MSIGFISTIAEMAEKSERALLVPWAHETGRLEKAGGPGSRGGHIIGYSGGTPIYAKLKPKDPHYKGMSFEDHEHAGELHLSRAAHHTEKAAAHQAEHKRLGGDEGHPDAYKHKMSAEKSRAKSARHTIIGNRHLALAGRMEEGRD